MIAPPEAHSVRGNGSKAHAFPLGGTTRPPRLPASMHAEAAKYLKVLSIGIQDTFVYRWNFLLRALFGIVPLLATVFIWRAVFAARQTTIGTYDLGEMIFYFLLIMFVE